MDDGLLQDENEIEDFPDEDEEEEEARQVEETTVTPVTNDNDEGTYFRLDFWPLFQQAGAGVNEIPKFLSFCLDF